MASFSKSASQILSQLSTPKAPVKRRAPSPGETDAKRSRIFLSDIHVDYHNFFDRLKTFDVARISVWYCARYGWLKVEKELMQCVGCRKYLSTSLPSVDVYSIKSYRKRVELLNQNIINAHGRDCTYSSNPTAEATICPAVVVREDAHKLFEQRLGQYQSTKLTFPSTLLTLKELGVREKYISCLLEMFSIESDLATMVVTGFVPSSFKDVVECGYCLRQVGLWNFDGSIDGGAKLVATSQRPVQKKEFNPVKQHRFYCPWRSLDAAASSAVKPLPDDSPTEREELTKEEPYPRWKLFVHTLVYPRLLTTGNGRVTEASTVAENDENMLDSTKAAQFVSMAKQMLGETVSKHILRDEKIDGGTNKDPPSADQSAAPATEGQKDDDSSKSNPDAQHKQIIFGSANQLATETKQDPNIPYQSSVGNIASSEIPATRAGEFAWDQIQAAGGSSVSAELPVSSSAAVVAVPTTDSVAKDAAVKTDFTPSPGSTATIAVPSVVSFFQSSSNTRAVDSNNVANTLTTLSTAPFSSATTTSIPSLFGNSSSPFATAAAGSMTVSFGSLANSASASLPFSKPVITAIQQPQPQQEQWRPSEVVIMPQPESVDLQSSSPFALAPVQQQQQTAFSTSFADLASRAATTSSPVNEHIRPPSTVDSNSSKPISVETTTIVNKAHQEEKEEEGVDETDNSSWQAQLFSPLETVQQAQQEQGHVGQESSPAVPIVHELAGNDVMKRERQVEESSVVITEEEATNDPNPTSPLSSSNNPPPSYHQDLQSSSPSSNNIINASSSSKLPPLIGNDAQIIPLSADNGNGAVHGQSFGQQEQLRSSTLEKFDNNGGGVQEYSTATITSDARQLLDTASSSEVNDSLDPTVNNGQRLLQKDGDGSCVEIIEESSTTEEGNSNLGSVNLNNNDDDDDIQALD